MSRANLHVLLGMDIEQEPRNLFSLYERVLADARRTGRCLVRAQTLQANTRPWRGKLEVLPGIPKMQMAGLEEFVEDPGRTTEIFAEVLHTAKGFYEFRIVDVGPDFNLPIHWAAIQEADTVLLVITPERTSILDVRNIIPALELAFGTLQRFKIVLNGFDEQFGISPKEVVKYLGGKIPIVATLPYAPTDTRLAINLGKPLTGEKKLSPIGQALIRLGAMFYPPLDVIERKKPKQERVGLFSRARQVFTGG
jgi:Flp pilus assembly CpaE family ATPase